MVVMVTIQYGFINSNILETSKDRPNIPPSLKLLKQRVHELVRGPLIPLLNNVVRSKRLRSGRVIRIIYDECNFSFWYTEVSAYVYNFVYLCRSLLEQHVELVLRFF